MVNEMQISQNIPKISIAITVLNSVKTIRRALDSLIAQHYPNLEVVVWDGASTDGTLEVLRSYSHIITRLESGKDTGTPDGLNKAMDMATGDYIGFLNGDDEFEPGALWAVADAIKNNPDTEVVTFGIMYRIYKDNGNSLIKGYYADERQLALTLPYVLIENQTFMLSRFIKRSVVQEIGKLNTDHNLWYISNDREWMSRLALRGCRNTIIPKALYGFVLHPGSMSNKPENYAKIIDEHCQLARHLYCNQALSQDDKQVVAAWHKRQLVFGFWQVLAQRKVAKAFSFYRQGLSIGGAGFVLLSIKLLLQKIIKRIALKISNSIDTGAF